MVPLLMDTAKERMGLTRGQKADYENKYKFGILYEMRARGYS